MMITHHSCSLTGLDPSLVQVEVDLSNGLPRFDIVGLPDSTVQEAKQRIRSAIKNSGFDFPVHRITINLAPADLPKEGSGFDLSMALGILKASGQSSLSERNGDAEWDLDRTGDDEPNPPQTDLNRDDPKKPHTDFLILGELGLDGSVRSIPGVLAMAARLHADGLRKLIVPEENAREASVFPNLQVWPVRSLAEAASVLVDERDPLQEKTTWSPDENWTEDFREVKGQENVKRALEIAAAGNHNVLMVGPPGSGKTMLARRFPGILPTPSFEECLEIAKVRSVAGLLRHDKGLVGRRPFRAPHSGISNAGFIGGGNPIRPGAVTLAHQGVLFMDELPQFRRDILESLRQPLEDKCVSVSRVSGFVTYPADFLLLAAMNPCPCGFYGDLRRNCICGTSELVHYRKRLSGPILDRIDLHIEISALPHEKLYSDTKPESSSEIKKRVKKARNIQELRFGSSLRANASMNQEEMEKYCEIGSGARQLLKKAFERLCFSARGHSKILKVARTIADLAGSEKIETLHLAEALQYRVLDRSILNE